MNEEVPAFPHPDKKPLVDQSSNESNSKYPYPYQTFAPSNCNPNRHGNVGNHYDYC